MVVSISHLCTGGLLGLFLKHCVIKVDVILKTSNDVMFAMVSCLQCSCVSNAVMMYQYG